MIDCAKYFEEKEEYEKAVQLYQKGGDIPKALDLCFRAGSQGRTAMFEMLTTIAEGLGADTSPQVPPPPPSSGSSSSSSSSSSSK